jgi:hypothetical protein
MTAWILFVLGLAVGAGMGTAGALVGGSVGALAGLAVYAIGRMHARVSEPVPAVESHSVMCFPYGQAADCEFVGDRRSGRWYDVRRCSLLKVPTDVGCDKGCIRLMNLTHDRPGVAPSP